MTTRQEEIEAIEEEARAYQRAGNTRAAASLRAKAKKIREAYAELEREQARRPATGDAA